MRCEELKSRLETGGPADAAAKEHLAGCAGCRAEWGFLEEVRSSRPEPPAGLRERVLEAYPAPRRAVRWGIPAAAAAVALAFASGIAVGRGVEREQVPPVEIQRVVEERVVEKIVVREVEKPVIDEDLLAVLAIAAESVYGEDKVRIQWGKAVSVKAVSIDHSIHNWEQYCPVARKLRDAAATYTEKVRFPQE